MRPVIFSHYGLIEYQTKKRILRELKQLMELTAHESLVFKINEKFKQKSNI